MRRSERIGDPHVTTVSLKLPAILIAIAATMRRRWRCLRAGVPEWLSPLTSIVPGQLIAMHTAHARDFDPNRPRGLCKVTETR